MWIVRLVVYAAILATLAFNGSYAWSRGSSLHEQILLVVLAVIIDAAKTSFLAGAGFLRDHRHYVAALILFVLWWPAFALSTWAGFSNIATWRAASSSDKVTAGDTRSRAQARYDQARRQLALITSAPTFTQTAGCTQTKVQAQRTFCDGYAKANAEVKTADAALSTTHAGKADPETALLADISGLPRQLVEFLVAFIPSLFVELIAALGFYVITRPIREVRREHVVKASGVAVQPVLEPVRQVAATKPENTPQAPPALPEMPRPRSSGGGLVLKPGK